MSKAKVDFIAELLSNKAIKTVHKEKLFYLAVEEIKKVGESDETIVKKLAELEAEISLITQIWHLFYTLHFNAFKIFF